MSNRATARDVARRAGVSRTTVSFVLNDVTGMRISPETRQRVLDAASELKYHPDVSARRLVSGRTQVIGYIECQSTGQAFADVFLPEVLRGLHEAVCDQGFHVLFEPIAPDQNSTDRYAQLIRERHVDGIVFSGPRFDNSDELLRLHDEGVPVVLQGRLPGASIPYVDVDNVGGARQAVEHLIALGHERIALITNAPLVYTAAADRRAGYAGALQRAGIPVEPALMQTGSFSAQSGAAAMRDLLALPDRPTAVFVAGDTVAIGAIQAAREAGLRVPGDIAFVGFDDVPLAEYLDPPLTTIRLPAYGLGWGAAEALVRLINGEELQTTEILFDTELIVRESCGVSRR
ncbi:MAG: LacI family DNA-binding transcriptional regulator [Anaerolineales bacterium]